MAKKIVEGSDTFAGKIFDLFIQLLIILSIVSFSIETLPDLSNYTSKILRYFNILCIAILSLTILLIRKVQLNTIFLGIFRPISK